MGSNNHVRHIVVEIRMIILSSKTIWNIRCQFDIADIWLIPLDHVTSNRLVRTWRDTEASSDESVLSRKEKRKESSYKCNTFILNINQDISICLHTDCFEGYQNKPQHPMYTTTAMVYGAKKPTVHTMPTSFHCKSQSFSEVSTAEICHLVVGNLCSSFLLVFGGI